MQVDFQGLERSWVRETQTRKSINCFDQQQEFQDWQ